MIQFEFLCFHLESNQVYSKDRLKLWRCFCHLSGGINATSVRLLNELIYINTYQPSNYQPHILIS
ncbi:TPA_asm: hypothetical protein [Monosiga MELD virus 2]|nr:TPA_asm: hypothetical protein [Monosiga MELD virus 2]